jgi:hypothetical protein
VRENIRYNELGYVGIEIARFIAAINNTEK